MVVTTAKTLDPPLRDRGGRVTHRVFLLPLSPWSQDLAVHRPAIVLKSEIATVLVQTF
jgi:hypothetical protein